MLYETKVYQPDGSLKRTISAKAIVRRHWRNFSRDEAGRQAKLMKDDILAAKLLRLKKITGMNKLLDGFVRDHG